MVKNRACNYLCPDFKLSISIRQTNPCRDMFVGRLNKGQYVENARRYQAPESYAIDYAPNSVCYDLNTPKNFENEVIVCILESPHRDEYFKKANPSWGHAAMGRTGKQFDKRFYKKLSQNHSNIASKTYDIVLINSVQYQCSNGRWSLNKNLRDTNWDYMIKDKCVYDDLLQRIRIFNPQYIINLCTKGNINL